MAIRVKLPTGEIGEFPDSMSHEQIESVLQKQFGGPQEEQGFFNKLPRNIGAGLLEGARGIGNIPHMLHLPNAPYFEQTDFGKMTGLTGDPTLSDKIIQGISQFAPSIALPGANIGRAGQAIGNIPKIGKFAQGAVEQAIPQAAYGATQNENPLIGAAEGGLGSVAGSALGLALGKGFNALRPSKRFRGELSPEKLEKNLEVTKGTETNLGDVIQSPTLKRIYQNILPHIIGSGTYKTMAKNAENIKKSGQRLIEKYAGGFNPSNYGEKIKEALINSSKDVENIKNNKFNKVNDLAEEANVTTDREYLRKEAKSLLGQIKSDPDLAKFVDASDRKLLEELSGNKQIEIEPINGKQRTFEGNIDISGRPIKLSRDPITGELINPETEMKQFSKTGSTHVSVSPITGKALEQRGGFSIKNTDILRGKVGKKAYEAAFKGETDRASIYTRLKNALEKDVEEAIYKSGSDQLKSAHKNAMDFYRDEYALYKDKDILKFIKKGGDADLILSHFIKGGKNDRAVLLQKISKAVRQQPHGTDNILASSYLSRAFNKEGELNPLELKTLYHDLGKNQANALFGTGKMHETIKNYVDLVGKNTEGFNLMFNATNGQRNIDLLAKMGQISASLAHGGGTTSFLAPLLGLGVTARVANKVLSNPTYREKLVNAMIENKEIPLTKTKKALQKGGAISSGLLQLLLTKGI